MDDKKTDNDLPASEPNSSSKLSDDYSVLPTSADESTTTTPSDPTPIAVKEQPPITDAAASLAPEPTESEMSATSANSAITSEPKTETTAPLSSPNPLESKEAASSPEPTKPESMTQPTAMGSPMSSANNSSHKKALVISIVIISILLIAGTVYFFMTNSDKNAKTTEITQPPTANVETSTADDVSSTTTEIDNALKEVDDTKDFAESDLSDESLGL